MNKRLVLMSAAAAVLGAYVLIGEGGPLSGLWQTPAPGTGPDAPSPATQGETPAAGKPRDGVKLNPLQGLDAQSFAAMVEKPLFNPGRVARPAEPPPPPPEPAAPETEPDVAPPAEDPGPVASDYKLLAVSTGPSGRIAALRLTQANEVVFVREGQEVQQWKVITVGPRSIVIGTPERHVEVGMFENTGDPSGEPPVSPGVDEGQMPDLPVPGGEPPVPPDPQPEGGN